MSKPVIRALDAARHPNPEAFELSWPEVEGLFAEHEKLAEEADKVNAELREAEAKLKAEETALPRKRAQAARTGGITSTKRLEKLKAEVAELKGKSEDLTRAAGLVEADIQAALLENRDRYLEEIEQKRMEAAGRAQKIRAELASEEWWFTATDRLRNYLTQPRIRGELRFMGAPPRPEAPERVGN